MSAEADIYPLHAPELAEKIEGAIGEGSQFHQTFGYYAQGVGPNTAVLPRGWMSRVHRVQTAAPTTTVSAIALTCSTYSCPRPSRDGRRTASSAWQCSPMAM